VVGQAVGDCAPEEAGGAVRADEGCDPQASRAQGDGVAAAALQFLWRPCGWAERRVCAAVAVHYGGQVHRR